MSQLARLANITYLKTARELNHFFGLNVLQTIDTGNTVTNGQDTTGFLEISFRGSTEDALLKDRRDFRSRSLGSGVVSQGSGSCSTKTDLKLGNMSA